MNHLVIQIIINKMEAIIKKKNNLNNLDNKLRNQIKIWANKMYNDFEKNNETSEIINNNLEDNDYEDYIDYDELLYI